MRMGPCSTSTLLLRTVLELEGNAPMALSKLWREKQLQYTWLRSLMGEHKDFWQVTGDALDFAMKSLEIHRYPRVCVTDS